MSRLPPQVPIHRAIESLVPLPTPDPQAIVAAKEIGFIEHAFPPKDIMRLCPISRGFVQHFYFAYAALACPVATQTTATMLI